MTHLGVFYRDSQPNSNKHLAVGTPALGSGRWQAAVQAAVLRQVAVDVWLCWAAAVGRGMFCGKAAVAGG